MPRYPTPVPGLFRETAESIARQRCDCATFRDQTAAMILAGMVANPERRSPTPAFLAEMAVRLADALCQELARPADSAPLP